MNDKVRVLIVDDSEVMRKMIGDTLKKEGFEIAGNARDGSEAVEKYNALQPDVVTMDIVMPKEHGIEAVKKIVAQDEKARIIVISGLFQKSLVMEALEVGAKDFLIKPFEPADLVNSVRKSMADT